MNIVCVYSLVDYVTVQTPLPYPGIIPFGISLVAASLQRAGHKVKLLVFTPATPVRQIIQEVIQSFRPALFCLTSVSSQINIISQVGQCLKELDSSIFAVLGGHHATLNPEEAIAHNWVDAICRGEGEDAAVELASQLEEGLSPSGIANLWIKNPTSGQIERNQPRPFRVGLDDLPFIDRDMWAPWIAGRMNKQTVLVGRGCPNQCSYCSNHALARIARGKYVRFRSPQNIIAELQQMVKKFPGMDEVYLEVESLGASLPYAHRLLAQLAEFNRGLPNPLSFGVNLAIVGRVRGNRELLAAFKTANFKFINIGLESGSERIRHEVLRRPRYTNADVIDFCRLARELAIMVRIYALIGIPGESLADFAETLRVTRECQPEQIYPSIFYPYPGTRLFELCREQHLFRGKFTLDIRERNISVLNLPGFPAWRIRAEYLLFPYKVYQGRLPRTAVLARTLRGAISAYPFLQSLYRRILDKQGMFAGLRKKFS